MKRVSIILLFLFAANVLAQNDGPGNTGLSFLKLGVTSRALSMGEAVVSNVNDASATFYNPAALHNGSKVNLLFMHNENILGIRSEYFAAKVIFGKLAGGFSVNTNTVGNIEIREVPGAPLGTFDAQNFAMSFTGAYKVNDKLKIGATAKFIFEKIYLDNADGYAFDLGGIYSEKSFSIGATIANIGNMNRLKNIATKLPMSVRGGATYNFSFPSISGALKVSADGYKVIDGGITHLNAGAEFVYKDFLSIRAGYQSGYEDRTITTGVGLRYKAISLDYAFIPYKYSLGSGHTFTLGTSF